MLLLLDWGRESVPARAGNPQGPDEPLCHSVLRDCRPMLHATALRTKVDESCFCCKVYLLAIPCSAVLFGLCIDQARLLGSAYSIAISTQSTTFTDGIITRVKRATQCFPGQRQHDKPPRSAQAVRVGLHKPISHQPLWSPTCCAGMLARYGYCGGCKGCCMGCAKPL
jgi:hypothetical protein